MYMKTVVITGSARGFGFEMLKVFRENSFNVVVCDIKNVEEAKAKLLKINNKSEVIGIEADISKESDVDKMLKIITNKFGNIDIFINNASINQPDKYFWNLKEREISKLIDVDLKGTLLCTNKVIRVMLKKGSGAIYNVEGFGSNDSIIPKLTLYGTSKRAVTYFSESISKELEKKDIIVGRLSPGIMITDFLVDSLGEDKNELDDKTKKVYNMLGDYPDVIAKYMVPKIINNKKNNVRIEWLTKKKVFSKIIKFKFKKNNYFD